MLHRPETNTDAINAAGLLRIQAIPLHFVPSAAIPLTAGIKNNGEGVYKWIQFEGINV
jgi:hypothetical protein